MPRNGLFADDGRVNDLASAIGRRTAELLTRIASLSDRAGALEAGRADHAATLNSIDLMIKALKSRDTDMETVIEGKADRSALAALSSKLTGYYDANSVDVLLENINDSISDIAEYMHRLSAKTETLYGKVVQTNGFHGLGKSDRFIPVIRDNSVGGITYDTSFGSGCLVIPETGYYDIKVTIYASGGVGLVAGTAAMQQPGMSGWYDAAVVLQHKATGEDMTLTRSECVYMPKGTKVAPQARSPYHDVGFSSWGDSNMTGTTLAVTRI